MTLEGFEDVENLLAPASDMIYAPSPREVFDRLVPQCAVGLVFAALGAILGKRAQCENERDAKRHRKTPTRCLRS